ncbi:hypothetical protein DIPPA_08955 [Diplonema papillatum]|nr:hypothetical protein DIPPA_08955 [Diplonema papillatum]
MNGALPNDRTAGMKQRAMFQRSKTDTARTKAAVRVVTVRKHPNRRSFSMPIQSGRAPTSVTAGSLTTTPRSQAPDKAKQAMEKAVRKTVSRGVRDQDFRRTRSLPVAAARATAPMSMQQINKQFSARADPTTKRIQMLRKKLLIIITELEDLERRHPSGAHAGWELALREGERRAEYLQGLLSQALEELKVQRIARGRAEEELMRIRPQGVKTSLDDELRSELALAGVKTDASGEALTAQREAALEMQVANLAREKELLQMQLNIFNERSPHRLAAPVNRDGMKRIELEARCTTLEQMVRTHEVARAQLVLPNTVRIILAGHDVPDHMKEAIMAEIHEQIQGRVKTITHDSITSPSPRLSKASRSPRSHSETPPREKPRQATPRHALASPR